ncbi:MAG: aminotransferase class V-fold PLP-dependent enzyme [Gemmatimonadetes bacterium]|nr:aminotransferase class V-fold PLP-dependent enzyme [Gemmatimonadota bacterium]
MTNRRSFLGAAAAAGVAPLLSPRLLDAMERRLEPWRGRAPSVAATEEEFWDEIRQAFPVHPYINLENGYSSPQPRMTWDAFQRHEKDVNDGLSFYMRRRRAADHARVKAELGAVAGVPADEIVITRNTTESMATVIHGIETAPGDEAVMCNQDYGSMLEQYRQQGRRRGLKNVEISVPLHPKSDDEVVDAYAAAITPRTKLLHLSHMINISGQILPVRKIADMAHSRGVSVIVDGAHALAHLDFTIPQLGSDYYGASLHKWLCTPLGAGLLHIKKEKIASVWPLMGDASHADDDIAKLERIGTLPTWTIMAISDAIRFHTMVGVQRKEARLRYLQEYWTSRVREIPKVYLNTPTGHRAAGIANVGITGMTPEALATVLFDRFQVYTVAINNVAVKGVRVTPHLYTTTAELDTFVTAIRELARG